MGAIDDLARVYSSVLRTAQHPKLDAVGIAADVLVLRYADSGEPLSNEDRRTLVQLIATELGDEHQNVEVVQALKIMLRIAT